MGVAVDFLRIARAQTAAVEGAGFPLAAYLGGAPLWSLPLFALFGILAHFGGFGENSISDIDLDRLDPNKQDHPIVSGRVRVNRALLFVYACQALGLLLFLAVLEVRGHVVLVPIAAILGYIALGHAYNFLGKRWKPGAVLEISGAFALAFLACGAAWTGRATELVDAVAAYAFLFVAFQIAVAGEAKELAQTNEANLLRRLGSRVVGGRLEAGDVAPWFGALLSVGKAVALGLVAVAVGGVVWGASVAVVSAFAFQVYNRALLRDGPFAHDGRLRVMGIGEAGSYLLLVLALVPVLWPWLWIAFVVLPVAWFASLNRLLWARTGSAWAPGV